jgi:TfoX/Sxy family transcriptional regulator of competence genes
VQRVDEKKLFGSIAFMVAGKMCVTVGHDRLMCRIDPSLHQEAINRKGARTVKMKGREYKGYVYVDKDGLRSPRQLDYWLKLSLDFNKRAKSVRERKK